jgi:prolipoprotein diacylglyceryltransferase
MLEHDTTPKGWYSTSFARCGVAGYAAGTLLGMTLAAATGRSVAVVAWMAAVSMVAFFGVAVATKALTGQETLTFYHHALAMASACVLLLVLLRAPLLPNIEIAVLGLLTFLVFGRIGCHVAGCCHGRPHHRGISYAHRPDGLPAYVVGVPLLPVQLAEAVASAVIVVMGSAMLLRGWPPGSALVWCIGAYATARFFLEFGRGDDARRYSGGLSVPQWTSLVLAVSCAILAVLGDVPQLEMAVSFAATLVIVAVASRLLASTDAELFAPHHIHELSHLLEVGALDSPPRVRGTSGGLLVSTDRVVDDGREVRSYTVSHAAVPLKPSTAGRVAQLIVMLRHAGCDWRALSGATPGMFHVLVDDAASGGAETGIRSATTSLRPR